MKNRKILKAELIGAILAIPFFILLSSLEVGVWTHDQGICPLHKHDNQIGVGSSKTICEDRIERGIPEGEITGGGFTCIDGVYYQTNYRCITKTLGFIEAESGAVVILWVFLAIIYGAFIGIIVHLVGSRVGRKNKKQKMIKVGDVENFRKRYE